MCIFILSDHRPVKFPYLTPSDGSVPTSEQVNYFYTWVYFMLFIGISYPLWALQAFSVRSLPDFLKRLYLEGITPQNRR